MKIQQQMKMAKQNKLKREITAYIVNWNRLYPIDYWWRRKYKIPFGSEEHRQATFIQMFFDYEEEKMMNSLLDKEKDEDEDSLDFDTLAKSSGVGKKMSQEQIDDDFDQLDVSRYNISNQQDKKDG